MTTLEKIYQAQRMSINYFDINYEFEIHNEVDHWSFRITDFPNRGYHIPNEADQYEINRIVLSALKQFMDHKFLD